MNIFPEQTLSETEENVVAELINNPAMQKYLHTLSYNIGRDIVTAVPAPDESNDVWLKKELYLKGQIRLIETLLSIKPSK